MVRQMRVTKYSDSLQSEEFVLVDDEDFEKCKNIEWKWYEHPDSHLHLDSHKKVRGYDKNRDLVYLNRYVLDLAPDNKKLVIFKNSGDNKNYTRNNLQVVDRSYKSRNSIKTWGKSKYKGVSWDSGRQM
ncbi:hypothetical protein ACQKNX_22880 [Lysinibacillus sp. NPDC093712]|uniref:hypothetical protein n=1 Tax=Lysinibacillus sp. NPDC093712 TaxID=3390579 RepID=UPI003D03AF4A